MGCPTVESAWETPVNIVFSSSWWRTTGSDAGAGEKMISGKREDDAMAMTEVNGMRRGR
jgi:hypothetical protein